MSLLINNCICLTANIECTKESKIIAELFCASLGFYYICNVVKDTARHI